MFAFIRALLGAPARPGPEAIDARQAQALLDGRAAVLLDVRTDAERRLAHIPGSLHIPLADLGARLGELPSGATVVCQCASGQRSASAARFLQGRGLDARNLRGGLRGWQAAGLPTRPLPARGARP